MATANRRPDSSDVLAAFEAAFDFYFDPEDTHASFRHDDPHVVLALEFFAMLREPLAPLIEGVRPTSSSSCAAELAAPSCHGFLTSPVLPTSCGAWPTKPTALAGRLGPGVGGAL